MPNRLDPLVLLIGRPAAAAWQEIATGRLGVETVVMADVMTAADWLTRAPKMPAMIVVSQEYPGEIAMADIDHLRQASPLSPIHALASSWCEGELRSGKPWTTHRIYGHQWPQRASRELERLLGEHRGARALPPTASDEERVLNEASNWPLGGGTLAVVAESATARNALADACQAAGYSVMTMRANGGAGCRDVSAVVWDADATAMGNPFVVAGLARDFGGAPLLAVVGFPRPEQISAARAAGIAAVVSKPYLLADLLWQIDQLCSRRQAGSESSQVSSRSVRKISRHH